ncbi:hypothetical protein V8F33_011963 [Rhypophila sp. PSN 637]
MMDKHLPAGQPMQGGADMVPGPGGRAAPGAHGHVYTHGHGHNQGHGPRRGGRPQYANHYYQQHVPQQPMYPAANYGMNPYAGAYYPMPHYQNGGMPAQPYMQYPPAGYNRSPPAMNHYVPMPTAYSRPPQHSPIVTSSYQIPPPIVQAPPLPPPTPSSTHSLSGPPPMTPPVVQPETAPIPVESQPQPQPQPHVEVQPDVQQEIQPTLPPQSPSPSPSQAEAPASPVAEPKANRFRPPVPWMSHPDQPFPSRAPRSRKTRQINADAVRVDMPQNQYSSPAEDATEPEATPFVQGESQPTPEAADSQADAATPKVTSQVPAVEPRSETPSTQDQPSEDTTSTSPTTPSSVQPSRTPTATAATPNKSTKPALKPTVPAIPVIPILPRTSPKTSPKESKPSGATERPSAESEKATPVPIEGTPETSPKETNGKVEETAAPVAQSAPAPAKPRLWTGLFSKPAATSVNANASTTGSDSQTNGASAADGSAGASASAAGLGKPTGNALADALQAYRVDGSEKIAFLEPRGLVNTGNMCYMNSVLQVLVFCVTFYDFLDHVSKKAAHSFKSETPLLDAIILFMKEFKVIDSAASTEQLRRRLKNEELEQYGEQFIPEFVYDAIRKLPRFASMRRGHQQDAEEFLGFLLDGLHEECTQVMRVAPASTASTAPNSSLPSPTSSKPSEAEGNDWLEVGPRQRAAVTRSSGHSTISSPITKIFGGQLRSELRVPGLKTSITLEPYQPLQLDIGAPDVRNIVDALKGLTRAETLHGDFNSPQGKDSKAIKQVTIESLPPVLILHLKRFQFDAEGHGTVKIWKKIGYPLELEIPLEVLSRPKRNALNAEGAGLPRYRLISVVYHHGKNASGGHYTVDVRRQDGREWIRIDDTVIRRVRSEEVAEGGSEEEPAKANLGNSRKDGVPAANNRFVGMNDEDAGDDEDWKPAPASGKKWSSIVNGAQPSTNGAKPKQHHDSIKDNKVAYLLFYQRI